MTIICIFLNFVINIMVIKSYKYKDKIDKSVTLYYRVVLNNEDKRKLYEAENFIFQLKCIATLSLIFDIGKELDTKNLEFKDRLFPSSVSKKLSYFNPEFGLLFSHKTKKNYIIAIQIDYKYDGKIKIRDMYIYNTYSPLKRQYLYPFPEPEYRFLAELDTLLQNIFELPKKVQLCKNCKFYPEYQQRGYCLKWHPDTRLT